ncbi:MAG: hypothetical protein JXA19_00525 [Anaerolineales bacterium]|nr:hypothetical protein [Anaerolineales bacterium]
MNKLYTKDDLFLEDNSLPDELKHAWKEVEDSIRSSGMIAPAVGFVSRWQNRLIEDRRRMNRKQAWIIIGIGWGSALLLTILLLLRVVPAMPSVNLIWQNWIGDILATFTYLKIIINLIGPFIRNISKLLQNDMVWRIGISSMVGLSIVFFNIRRMVTGRGERI